MQNPASRWCPLYPRSVSPHSVLCRCKMGQSSVWTALFSRVAGGTQKDTNIHQGEAPPGTVVTHTAPRPEVNTYTRCFHPLSNWMLTTTVERHHSAHVPDENTEACFSRIQRLFPRITQPVRGVAERDVHTWNFWFKSSSLHTYHIVSLIQRGKEEGKGVERLIS